MSLVRATGLLLVVGLLSIAAGVLFRHSDSVIVVAIIYMGTAAFLLGALLLVALIGRRTSN